MTQIYPVTVRWIFLRHKTFQAVISVGLPPVFALGIGNALFGKPSCATGIVFVWMRLIDDAVKAGTHKLAAFKVRLHALVVNVLGDEVAAAIVRSISLEGAHPARQTDLGNFSKHSTPFSFSFEFCPTHFLKECISVIVLCIVGTVCQKTLNGIIVKVLFSVED